MTDRRPTPVEIAGVALVMASAALSALIEALLVPLYAGRVVFPIAVVLAVAGNIALPRLARQLVPTTLATVLPLLAWLAVMVGFGVYGRPEGDVILPGGPTGAEWVTYGVLLGGAVAGTFTVVMTMPPPAQRKPGAERVSR